MNGYKENIIKLRLKDDINSRISYANVGADKCIRFEDNYYIYCYRNYYCMHIYDSQTLQLLQIIPLVQYLNEKCHIETSANISTIIFAAATYIDHQV